MPFSKYQLTPTTGLLKMYELSVLIYGDCASSYWQVNSNTVDTIQLTYKMGKLLGKRVKESRHNAVFITLLHRLFRGDGGSRTLVQTRNPHGFYMLIPLLFFVPCKGANALNTTLSPKFRLAVGAPTRLSRNCLAPRAQAGIRNLHLRDVSSAHLVCG